MKLLKSTFAVSYCYVCTTIFTLDTFPYATTFESWANVMIAIGQG